MLAWMLRFYEWLPEWVVAAALLAAGGSWVLNYHWKRRRRPLPLVPALSLTNAAGLIMLGLFYAGLALGDVPFEARAGAVRFLLVLLSALQIIYNGGVISGSVKGWFRGLE